MTRSVFENATKNWKRLIDVIVKQFGCNANEVGPDTKFKDLGEDSLDHVELCIETETEFDTPMSDEACDNFTCARDIAEYLANMGAGDFLIPDNGSIKEVFLESRK